MDEPVEMHETVAQALIMHPWSSSSRNAFSLPIARAISASSPACRAAGLYGTAARPGATGPL
ncbi:MAG TPA: hypothetical protein VKU39_05335 [Streptosporangiaceae bacterium]|nr:hypothetical protein [Streptosporangiaceae bacterium]